METMAIIKNKTPQILQDRKMTISDFQRESRLSYPSAHKVATLPTFPDTLNIGTIRRAAEALNVKISDLIELVEE